MKHIFLVFVFFYCWSLNAQKAVKPIVSINYVPSNNYGIRTINISGGICINDKFYLQYQLGYMKVHDSEVTNDVGIDLYTNSFFVGYRMFKKYKLSPIFRFEFGYQLFSNDKGKIIDEHLRYSQDNYYLAMGYYQSLIYGSLKGFLGYKIGNFELFAGIGYRSIRPTYLTFNNYQNDYIKNKYSINGWKLDFGISYTFQRKKSE